MILPTVALSIRQPWAWAILYAGKDVENRGWRASFRGDVLVHASKTWDEDGYRWLNDNLPASVSIPGPEAFRRGGIVGLTRIVDCVEASDSPWFFGPFGFVLDPTFSRPLPFRPCPGRLNFFSASYEGP